MDFVAVLGVPPDTPKNKGKQGPSVRVSGPDKIPPRQNPFGKLELLSFATGSIQNLKKSGIMV